MFTKEGTLQKYFSCCYLFITFSFHLPSLARSYHGLPEFCIAW